MTSAVEQLIDKDTVWEETGTAPDGGLPYATHAGIWNFCGQEIRVYRLNTGQAIIHADDMGKILGFVEAP